ncbi:hypothetical protein H6F43_02690 [Leptolyngbya sp. FACHB-36]|nr:hypothetical protein [Leptolyngbya sp. FACHB-36]
MVLFYGWHPTEALTASAASSPSISASISFVAIRSFSISQPTHLALINVLQSAQVLR